MFPRKRNLMLSKREQLRQIDKGSKINLKVVKLIGFLLYY